ncbi:response regulator [Phenylobacterium sp. LjRoot164]|uniref:hypothetical protein n=1 Tax=unclassified Phenylobacterium TaxID=2640670 RepID=UPI003ECFAA1F
MAELGLRDCRVLVVEDEYMLASELQRAMEDAGAVVLGPVARVEAALGLLAAEPHVDGAIVDLNLGGEMAYPVVEALIDRGIPLVLATGYDAQALPTRFAHLIRCEKPVELAKVARALGRALN